MGQQSPKKGGSSTDKKPRMRVGRRYRLIRVPTPGNGFCRCGKDLTVSDNIEQAPMWASSANLMQILVFDMVHKLALGGYAG